MAICLERGCPAIVKSGRCDAHGGERKPWTTALRAESLRIRGRALQALRAQLFRREPLCRICVQAGRTTAATIRDHIVPLAEGGLDIEANTQPLCQDCSDTKTKAESARGVRRSC